MVYLHVQFEANYSSDKQKCFDEWGKKRYVAATNIQ